MCSLYFLSAVGRWFGDPAAIAQVSRVMCMNMRVRTRISFMLFGCPQLQKKQGLNRFPLESRGQDVFVRRTEDAWKLSHH